MEYKKFSIPLIFSIMLVLLMVLSSPVIAASPYTSLRSPVVADNGVRELGVIFAHFTANQLEQGNIVTFRLPADFIWTTAAKGADKSRAQSAAQNTGEWDTSVVGATYVRYGTVNYVEVPATYSGDSNGLYQGTTKVLTFTRISDEEVKMQVTGVPTPGEDCCFYIYYKRIYVPKGFSGDIPLSFDSSSGSGFAAGTVSDSSADADDGKKISQPLQDDSKTSASFIVGQDSFNLNGSEISMDVAPYLKGDRVYLPIRYVAQALGINDTNIKWHEEEKSVVINKGERVVKLNIGNAVMYVNGKAFTLDAVPETVKPGRTMVSLRLVAEAFGADVQWDEATKKITIKTE